MKLGTSNNSLGLGPLSCSVTAAAADEEGDTPALPTPPPSGARPPFATVAGRVTQNQRFVAIIIRGRP